MSQRKLVRAGITGVSKFHPTKVLTNKDMEKMVDTSDAWIVERTGVKERHIVEKGQAASHLASEAAKRLLASTKTDPKEIDLIILTTVTPDMMFPSTACTVQNNIGAINAAGYDLVAACSGFIFGLTTGTQFIETGKYKKVMVIGVDIMSSIADYTDRNTCVLFGDGAGAVLLEPIADENFGIIDSIMRVDGSGGQYLYMPGGGSLNPPTHETVDKKMHFIHQDGRQVYKAAVSEMGNVSVEILKRNGFETKDLDILIPHQANLRIIESIAKRLELPIEKVIINIDKYANTTSATIPSCLYEGVQDGRIKKGTLVCCSSFGAGFTWGSVLLRWCY
jgi:3-oxoacyl-[acyl-carrier-protein] synthase III